MVIGFATRKILKLVAKIVTVLLFAATFLSAYGGYFNPQHWTLPAISLLFFPYFAMMSLVVSALWLICRHYLWGCMGILMLMACGPTFSETIPFRFGNKANDPERTFRMVTFNSLHLTDTKNPDAETNRSISFLIHSDADFICLQECYGLNPPLVPQKYQNQVDSLLSIYPYYSTDGGREVEFLSKYPFEYVDLDLKGIKYGSLAAYRFEIDGRKLTVLNVHLPSYLLSQDERNIITEVSSTKGVKKSLREFEGSVYSKLKNAFTMRASVAKAVADYASGEEGNVIVCGDFNDVPGSWTYRTFTKAGFQDAYAQTGFGYLITYNQHLMLFHIDQILYKGDIVPLNVRKERMNASDHYPLIAEFEFI